MSSQEPTPASASNQPSAPVPMTTVPIWRYINTTVAKAKAKSRLRWSWIFLCPGCALGLAITISAVLDPSPSASGTSNGLSHTEIVRNLLLIATPLMAYMSWGLYWGYVAFWPAIRQNSISQRWGKKLLNPFMWGAFLFIHLMLVPTLALYYGCFGGGIYQYLRHRRIIGA